MNICIFTKQHIASGRGGLENVTLELSNHLSSIGYNIFMLSAHKPIYNDQLLSQQFFLPHKEVNTLRNEQYITSFLYKHNIDIIINESYEICILNILVTANKKKVPIISVLHTDPVAAIKSVQDNWDFWKVKHGSVKFTFLYPYLYLRRLYQIYTRKKYTRLKHIYYYDKSDAVVLLSEQFFKSFQRISGVTDTKKLYAISNPNTIKVEKSNLAEKENIILFIGRLVFQKRLDRLLKIWNRIKDREGWKLIIVGDGPDRELYEVLCRKWNSNNIEFVGHCNPEPYYLKAKILCMTSSYEGSPLVITEALQNEVIPIAYNSYEAASDIIENKFNGYLIKPFSEEDYSKTLSALITDNELRNRIRNNIRSSNSGNKFSKSNIIDKWKCLLTEVCQKHE